MGKKKKTSIKKIQVPKESKIEEVINEEITEEEGKAVDSEIEKDISEVKIKAETKTSETPKMEIKADKRSKEEIIKDEWNKNVHISFKITKKDLVRVSKENGVELDPKLETNNFSKSEKENHSLVQDWKAMFFWEAQVEAYNKFMKLAEEGKALSEIQVKHISRIGTMMKDFEKVEAFSESEEKLPSTKQLAQLIIDLIWRVDSAKNNWFKIKYQLD